MLAFDGCLMSRDLPIARFSAGVMQPLCADLLPLHFVRGGTLEDWLKSRAMDYRSRTNARLLRKALRFTSDEPEMIALRVDGATITDTYWLRPEGSSLCYSNIQFTENAFWKFALNGPTIEDFSQPFSRTPELTNTGSFEKCWRLEPDSNWWLYKKGKPENVFSELMAYQLGKRLGFDMAEYEQVDEQTVRTRDFTQRASMNFESARALGLKADRHIENFELLQAIRPALALDYAKLVTLDALVYNADRHADNFGVLRNVESGQIVKLAPNYDNNLSLLAFHIPTPQAGEDFLREWQNLILFYHVPLQLPQLESDELHNMAACIKCEVDKEKAVDFLAYRYNYMQQTLFRAAQFSPFTLEP